MRTNFLILFLTLGLSARASDLKASIQESGLFWIVIGVLLMILIGIFLYLFRMEKKIKRLEEE